MIKLSTEALQYLKSIQYVPTEPLTINKHTLELREALKSIGFSNKNDGYISDNDLSSELSNLISTGEYEPSMFNGFYLSDTQRMSYDYVLYNLNPKTNVWEFEANKSNPFKFISTEPLDSLVTYVNSLVEGLEKYSMRVEGYKHIITKNIHEASWVVKPNWYPRGMFTTLWTVCEGLMENKTDASLEEYSNEIVRVCEYIKNNIEVLKFTPNSADNS